MIEVKQEDTSPGLDPRLNPQRSLITSRDIIDTVSDSANFFDQYPDPEALKAEICDFISRASDYASGLVCFGSDNIFTSEESRRKSNVDSKRVGLPVYDTKRHPARRAFSPLIVIVDEQRDIRHNREDRARLALDRLASKLYILVKEGHTQPEGQLQIPVVKRLTNSFEQAEFITRRARYPLSDLTLLGKPLRFV